MHDTVQLQISSFGYQDDFITSLTLHAIPLGKSALAYDS